MRERCLAVKALVNMEQMVDHYGIVMKKGRAPCPIHGGDNPDAFRLTPDKKGYACATGGCKGDVLSFVQHMEGTGTKEALEWLERYAGIDTSGQDTPKMAGKRAKVAQPDTKPTPDTPKTKYSTTASQTWAYKDKGGETVFEVRRFDEVGDGKRKICKPFTNGRAGLKDENRILYNLDAMNAEPEDFVVLVEGEKCAEAVTESGYIGTTNPMGSGQWKPEFGYGEALRGRDVLVIPDADEEAEKWLEAVRLDLFGKVKSLQVAALPDGWAEAHPEFKGHDIADYKEVEGELAMIDLICKLRAETKTQPYGAEEGIVVTPNDALRELAELHAAGQFEKIKFNQWIPGLNVVAYRSDLVVVMAQTGTGKTRALHNIPFHIKDLNYLMFDLELSRGILGLRYASMATGMTTKEILRKIKAGNCPHMPTIDHIHLDNTGNIDLDYMRDRVHLIEDITQKGIDVVGIDYIGLMKKKGFNSRYGALSEHVEGFKGFLNESGRTGIISTQCGRSSEGEEGYFKCPSMFAAKDSGSVENSAQLVIRMWRTSPEDRRKLGLNIGKWSHDEPPQEDFQLIADGLLISTEAEYNRRKEINDMQGEIF